MHGVGELNTNLQMSVVNERYIYIVTYYNTLLSVNAVDTAHV